MTRLLFLSQIRNKNSKRTKQDKKQLEYYKINIKSTKTRKKVNECWRCNKTIQLLSLQTLKPDF